MKKILISLVSVLFVAGLLGGCSFLGSSNNSVDSSVQNSGGIFESSEEEEKEYCTITFKQEGQPDITRQVEKGSDFYQEVPIVEKTGYTAEWNWEGIDMNNITTDLTIYAEETPNNYWIRYDANGGWMSEADTQSVTFDSEVELLVPATRDGWQFVAWKYNGETVTNGVWKIAQDEGEIVLVAEWLDVRETFTVTFRQEGQQDKVFEVKQYDAFDFELTPEVVPVTGYIIEWDMFRPTLEYMQENVVINAEIKPKIYSFHYNAEGYYEQSAFVQVYYNERFAGLDMTLQKEGYKLIGWEDEDGNVYTNETVWIWDLPNREEPRYLTPVFVEKEQIVITFVQADGSRETMTILEGDTLTNMQLPINKDCVGYKIKNYGWYIDKACTTKANFNNITKAMTVYTKAEKKTYTISFSVGKEATISPTYIEVKYGDAYKFPTPTHKSSYVKFDHWEDSNGEKVPDASAWFRDESITVWAVWNDPRENFTVSFVQEGQETKTFNVKQGDKFTNIPEVVFTPGYTTEWNKEALGKLANVQENVVVHAVATAKTYEIVLNANGGEVSKNILKVTYGEEYTLPTPTYEDHVFSGWQYNGKEVPISGEWTITDGDILLMAIWDEN